MSRTAPDVRVNYKTVAASQSDQVLGASNSAAKGDILQRLICVVGTAASSTVSIKDGTTSISVLPATVPVGTVVIEFGAKAIVGPWKVTTGAGVSVIAVGQFSG